MLNKVMLIGRLGQDPELRYAANGMPVCKFSVATDESYTDREGQKQEKTEWHRVVTFQKQAEHCSKYLHKGSLVFVEGSLSTNKWTDQQGQTRYMTEVKASRVQFLERKGEGSRQGMPADDYSQNNTQAQAPARQQQQQQDAGDDLGPAFPSEASGMDDVPF